MILKWFSKTSRTLAALTFLVGVGLSTLAFADRDPEHPKPWPERILRFLRTTADHAFVELTNAIFENVDELDLTLFEFSGKSKVGIEVQREVLDNFDLLNTYTVIDRARLKQESRPFASLTTWTEDVATTGLGTPFAGVIFEPQASIEWTNVRQVKALEFKREPSVKTLALAPANPAPFASPLPPLPDADVTELNPDVPTTFIDPSIRARFSKIPNLLTFPFRVPLHRTDVAKMKDGEILAYAFDGQIEIGASVGLKVIPTLNVLHAGLDIHGTAIVHGRHQISVLREDARYARVKLTNLFERGVKAGIKLAVERKDAFPGVKVLGESALTYDAKFVPFDLESTRMKSNQFDVVYRYDLEDPLGRAAFHKAVLGSFGLSEKHAERLISRTGGRFAKTGSLRVDLASILRLDWNNRRESLEATLELPDGTHHVLEAFREKKKERRTLFGATTETKTRRMTLYLDAELLAKRDPESIFVIAEITREDSNTRARELRKTIDAMEMFLRKPDILPEMAEHSDEKRSSSKPRRAWYGRSSFYYGYSLSLDEIGAFLRTDRALVEESARRNFGVDEAARLIEAWAAASRAFTENSSPPVLFKALRGVFAARFSIEPLTNVVFDAIPSHLVNYFVTAQNTGFGRVQERGKTITSVEKALTNTDRELGFETYAARLKRDDEAVITELKVEPLPNGLKKIRFTLPRPAANVVFRLFRVTALKKRKRIAEAIVNNWKGRFVVGENTLVLDPDSPDLLTARLSRALEQGDFYRLSMAFSQKDDRYGPTAFATDFQVDGPYPRFQ